MASIKDTLEQVLMDCEEYRAQSASGGEVLNKTLLSTLANNYDKGLLDTLYKEESLRAHFFTVLASGEAVFKCGVFLSFINSYEFLPDNYTAYKQKIGLGFDAGHYLMQLGDVVLNFPYKECVLKGGQTKDDEKRQEVFFNRVLAPDEVNRLLDEAAFTGWRRYTKEGEASVGDLKADDNMIIKGNNLVVLHSLRRRYGGKVKLIYIDPPYNTGSDSFGYNDSFKHSSWLVFMKNRLEAARPLLREDGCIFVQCDDNEQAYLKVLMDEVFGRENFVASLPRVTKKAGKSTDSISKNHDYILAYKRQTLELSQLDVNVDDYPLKDEFYDERGGYKLSQTLDYDSLQYSKTMDYEAEVNGIKFYAGGKDKYIERQAGNVKKIDWVWRWSKEKLDFGIKNGFVQVKGNRIYTKTYLKATISMSKPYCIEKITRGKNLTSLEFTENQYSNDMASKNIQQIFHAKNLFNYSKPEALLARIIEIATSPGDIVLDYHLGSGTTAAVAHKMGRQYIGVEQMDYIKSVTVERLRKVIAGEGGGVSKQTGWTGGGSFVYCEAANDAARYITRANEAADSGLDALLQELAAASCLNWQAAGQLRRSGEGGGRV